MQIGFTVASCMCEVTPDETLKSRYAENPKYKVQT